MNSVELKSYIKKNSSLLWYLPEGKKEDISPELLVETILNFGDMTAVKELFSIIGIREVAQIFNKIINSGTRRRNNLHELTINYFTLLFKRYAS